jgi:hypothetical protein
LHYNTAKNNSTNFGKQSFWLIGEEFFHVMWNSYQRQIRQQDKNNITVQKGEIQISGTDVDGKKSFEKPGNMNIAVAQIC